MFGNNQYNISSDLPQPAIIVNAPHISSTKKIEKYIENLQQLVSFAIQTTQNNTKYISCSAKKNLDDRISIYRPDFSGYYKLYLHDGRNNIYWENPEKYLVNYIKLLNTKLLKYNSFLHYLCVYIPNDISKIILEFI